MTELEHHDHAAAFRQAAWQTRLTALRWKTIARHWTDVTPQGRPTGDLTADASDLVLRLGRIVFATPDWTPGPRASYRVKAPDVLAPTTTDAALIASTALKGLDACTTLAAHHRPAANDDAILHKTEKGVRPGPPTRRLLPRYQALAEQGRKAVTTLGHATQALIPDSTHAGQEIALILLRATTPELPPAIASADFPLTSEEVLAHDRAAAPPGIHPHQHLRSSHSPRSGRGGLSP
jgi:hypothetical protein